MEIKNRIIHACQDLIMECGYRGFSMNELAARSGVSKRTLYRRFRSKDQVIEATLDMFMQDMGQDLESTIMQPGDPVTIMNDIFAQLLARGQFTLNSRSLDDLRRYYPHLWAKIDQFRRTRIHYIFSLLSPPGQPGLIHDVDPRIVLAVLTASIQAVLNPEFILSNGLTFEETAPQLSRVLLEGILALSSPRET
ncbi:MAG TPA: TetR/AcrR family transcriptional regulator [Syntrophomonadaceae bacterium]|nr:TetR/AcrR family transcriptional regulator [Syntrophomonadaceae bacterium]